MIIELAEKIRHYGIGSGGLSEEGEIKLIYLISEYKFS
jgi:hypothetical protein